ncbi:MAG: DUF3795 domain-containing protein [bacterium]
MSSKNLKSIAYCGLYCPKCYKMKIAAAAKQLLVELETAQDKGADFLQKSPDIKPILEKLIALECKKVCREGGGKSTTCPIKACCDEHAIIGCWKCPNLDTCKKLTPQFLENNKKLKELRIEAYIKQYK